jgi:hypothetical protein
MILLNFQRIMTVCYRGITRDKKRYPDASRFMPERFLDASGALTDDDPAEYVFGSGRRVCPGWLSCSILLSYEMWWVTLQQGRYTVDATLWSAIAAMLAAVEFSFAKDDQGRVIDFTPQFTGGLTQCVVSLCHSILLSLTISSLAPFWPSLAISHLARISRAIQNFAELGYSIYTYKESSLRK